MSNSAATWMEGRTRGSGRGQVTSTNPLRAQNISFKGISFEGISFEGISFEGCSLFEDLTYLNAGPRKGTAPPKFGRSS